MSDRHPHGPIFVVGAARSGTTLLQYMLGSHPNISAPTGESQFIIPLQRDASKFGGLTELANIERVLLEMQRISPEFIDTDLHGMRFDAPSLARDCVKHGADSITKIISHVYETNARGEGKQRWLDKTPYYILNLDTILSMFPDAQIIHLIRDGRDNVLSMLARKHDLRLFNVHHAAKTWQQYVEAGQSFGRHLTANQYHEIRYEDLVSDPTKHMADICEFLGEVFDPAVVAFKKSRDSGTKTPMLKQSIQGGNTNKWRTQMTPRSIRVVEGAVGETLERNGYQISTSTVRLPLLVRAGYRVHEYISRWISRNLGGIFAFR